MDENNMLLDGIQKFDMTSSKELKDREQSPEPLGAEFCVGIDGLVVFDGREEPRTILKEPLAQNLKANLSVQFYMHAL